MSKNSEGRNSFLPGLEMGFATVLCLWGVFIEGDGLRSLVMFPIFYVIGVVMRLTGWHKSSIWD